MANIDTNSGNDAKKGKPQRKTLRVDFTPDGRYEYVVDHILYVLYHT